MQFKKGEIWRLKDLTLVEILGVADNPSFIYVANLEDSHRYQFTLKRSRFDKLISSPIPFEDAIATDAIATDAIATDAIVNPLAQDNFIDHLIEVSDRYIQQNQEPNPHKTSRGGKREGSGRKLTGRKERKVLQLNLDIAKKLPELNRLASLIDEFRVLAYSTKLRSENLQKFYIALDALERIA